MMRFRRETEVDKVTKKMEREIQTGGSVGIFLQTDNDKPAYNFYQKIGFGNLGAQVSLYKSLIQHGGKEK